MKNYEHEDITNQFFKKYMTDIRVQLSDPVMISFDAAVKRVYERKAFGVITTYEYPNGKSGEALILDFEKPLKEMSVNYVEMLSDIVLKETEKYNLLDSNPKSAKNC